MSDPDVTIVIPYHRARAENGMLSRAVRSAQAQTVPCRIIEVEDTDRQGAALTRERGLQEVVTEWAAFLDSDDELDPDHVEGLLAHAKETGADYVYPWFRVVGGTDPFPMFFGRPWDDDAPHSTTITILIRTGLAQRVGFRNVSWEDWDFTLRCIEAGAIISHLPKRSWNWFHHGANSMGTPGRGDAA